MANFTAVNKAIKVAYPTLDIEAVRGDGYVYFDGDDGFDKIASIYSHPTSTTTTIMIMICFEEIEDVLKANEKARQALQSIAKPSGRTIEVVQAELESASDALRATTSNLHSDQLASKRNTLRAELLTLRNTPE